MDLIRYPVRDSWPEICERATSSEATTVQRKVRVILDAVRSGKDRALRDFTRKFDGIDLKDLRVPEEKLAKAASVVSPALREAIGISIRNVRTFHEQQVPKDLVVETQPGVVCRRRATPVESVGLYVPGGTAPLFSTVVMLGVPARIAGCRQIVVCSPPTEDGTVDPLIAATARMIGLNFIVPVGGAHVIGALAYGTESVPRVDKIFGPGNNWVTTAKQLVAAEGVAIDMPAGPTELMIVADDSVPLEFAAADVLAQAEHGPDSQIVVVTWSKTFAEALPEHIERQLASLPRRDIARSALSNSHIVLVTNRGEAADLANAYAAEHLTLMCEDPSSMAERIEHAGSIFLGAFTPEAVGDYASGTNHTLPTGGFARQVSGVSVDAFMKHMTLQEVSLDGLAELGPHVQEMARGESLEGHARSISVRLDHLQER